MLSDMTRAYMRDQESLKQFDDWKPPKDLIEGVVASGSITLLTGAPKSGKSFIAQSMAHAVATGTPWFGHPVERGAVLYLNPDGEYLALLAERIRALVIETGQDFEDDYLKARQTFSIQNSKDRDEVLRGVAYEGLRLIVIDTLAASVGNLDLNAQKDISVIGDYLKSITRASQGKTAVLVLLHAPKSDPKGVSGSTQLKALASRVYSMERKLQKPHKYVLECTDSRDTAGDFRDTFRLKEINLNGERSSAVMVETNPLTTRESAIRAEIEATLDELKPGEWQPQSWLVKAVMERGLANSDTQAREYLKRAVEVGVLEVMGEQRNKAFALTARQTPQTVTVGDKHSVPANTPTLKGGEWGDAGEDTF